jgi:PKD repeat protein
MSRRIVLTCIVLGLLALSASIVMSKASAATPTPTPVTFPQADFVATPLSGAAPLTVQFTHLYTITTTATINYCSWTFGDGTSQYVRGSFSTCPSVSHVYTGGGNFTVLLTVGISDMLISVTKTNYIQVSGPVAPTPTVTPTTDPCASAIYTISGRVYDAATNLGIANASVFLWTAINSAPTATTAADGSYSLPITNPYLGCNILGLVVSADGYQTVTQAINWQDLKAQPQRDFAMTRAGTPTRTSTPGMTSTLTRTPTGPTPTRTPSPRASLTPTRTPTCLCLLPTSTRTPTARTNTPTRTNTPSLVVGVCSPVTSTITAPFTYDGAGAFCWQSGNLGTYISSWNLASLTVNGVSYTNLYVAAASYPARINGYWYVGYNSAVAYGHFEAK